MARAKGVFIVLDGPEGCGKSTQLRRLADELTRRGRRVVVTREPGGTRMGEKIRDVLLAPETGDLLPETEMLLFMACRAELVRGVIQPGLRKGAVVLCDRFLSSTVVYQGYVGGVAVRDIERIGRIATRGVSPDLTVILDLDAKTGLARKGGEETRFEHKPLAYHRRVRAGFRAYARTHAPRAVRVNAVGSVEAVHARILRAVSRVL